MPDDFDPRQDARQTNADKTGDGRLSIVLTAHRSLPPAGFAVLMTLVGAVSFIAGMAFLMIGAWPVLGFFGLDVLLIYAAFRLNYREGRIYETVDLDPALLKITRVLPSGKSDSFEFNPYWVRVNLDEDQDGRTSLTLLSHGRSFRFGHFLSDDDRREVADVLSNALAAARAPGQAI